MHSYLSGTKYAQSISLLSIEGVEKLSTDEMTMLSSSLSLEVETSPPTPRMADFYEVLKDRAKRSNVEMDGMRKDFISRYRELYIWKSPPPQAILHTELKLCLRMLIHKRLEPTTIIGVTKLPCFSCEKWVSAVISLPGIPTQFLVAPGHRKVYGSWQFPGIVRADNAVRKIIWTLVDEIVATTPHHDHRDMIIPKIRNYKFDESIQFDETENENWMTEVAKLISVDWYCAFPFYLNLQKLWTDFKGNMPRSRRNSAKSQRSHR
jgi:hypothetical protein